MDTSRPCASCPAVAVRGGLCRACWHEQHIQAAITLDRALIKRADLDQHERYVLLRRAERGQR